MTHVPMKTLRAAVLGPMLVAISSCGGGGDGGASCSPPPAISSTPPTTATVGQQYAYWVDASYVCIPFFTPCGGIDGVQLPPGAGIDDFRDLVYWTPAPSHAGTSVPFTIATEPDLCGDRATQSWSVSVSSSVSVFEPPVIESFVASKEAVNPGESVELTAVFMGEGWIGGLGIVTSGVPVQTPGLASSTSYTLSVRNSAGAQTSYTLWVQVIGPPSIQSLTATPDAIGMGASTTLRWSVSGQYSVARLDPPGIDVIGSSSIVVTPNATTTYVLTLENVLGVSASASVQVEVVPPSAIFSFSATPASTVPGGSVAISASFNGTGTMERESATGWYEPLGPIESGGTMDSGELLRSTAFRLSVRNAVGQMTTQDLVVPLTGPGTFQPTSGKPVSPARVRHAATRLADGRVFISGGQSPVGTPASTTELYDPATDSFSAGPSLLEARSEHSATLLVDGRVLIAGGRGVGAQAEMTAEIFDPATGTIQPAGSLPGPAKLLPTPALALLDGRAAVVASIPGIPSQHGVVIYDPIANGFGGFIPFAVLDGVSSAQRLADGRGLFIRGSGRSEIFMPGPDSFVLTGAVTTFRGIDFATAVLGDGRVLVTGGTVDASTPAEIYDPGTGTFNVTGQQQFFARRYGRTVTLASGMALAVGGGDLGFGTPWAELFDPAAGTFSPTGGLRTGRWSHTATLLQDGRVLVVGGCSAAPCDAELYSP